MTQVVHNVDCRVFFSDSNPLFSYDVMITDPPYREAVHKRAVSQSKTRGARSRDLGFEPITEELRALTCAAAARAWRWSVVFSDLESTTLWVDGLHAAGAHYIRTIPWVRWSMPQLSGDRPTQGAEAVIVAYGRGRGKKHWNGPGNLTHLAHKCLRGEMKHRAEKPLDQALDLVDYFSDPGETVFDPFAGAGTFGVAAKLLGRNYVGCELDETWARRAQRRIDGTIVTSGCDEVSRAASERDAGRYARWRSSRI